MPEKQLEPKMPVVAEREAGGQEVSSYRELDSEVLLQITQDLEKWDSGSKIRELADQYRRQGEAAIRPLEDAISDSERLTESDLAVRINMRD
jgi:hypothetical protein